MALFQVWNKDTTQCCNKRDTKKNGSSGIKFIQF